MKKTVNHPFWVTRKVGGMGDELIVQTSRINYPYFDDLGTPQSGNLKLSERYRLSKGDTRLDWEIIAVDSEIFLEPVFKWLYGLGAGRRGKAF